MGIMTLYVKGSSKKEINERLTAGRTVYGENMSFFSGAGTYTLDGDLPSGTVIKVYEKLSGGSPYAKAYGTWDADKKQVK